MSEIATVYLVDDDESHLHALSRLLRTSGFDVSAHASSAQFARDIAPRARGCVVADLEMPGLNGFELQAELVNTNVVMPVIFLTAHGDIPSTVRAMRGGASDFLEKSAPREVMMAAIRGALDQDAAQHAARVRARELWGRFEKLTPREREVLQHVVLGRMNKEIAATLGINERTVKLHRTAITTKVGVQSVAQLALLTRDSGLFEAKTATFP
jgi:FixJ family two-component response regulator